MQKWTRAVVNQSVPALAIVAVGMLVIPLPSVILDLLFLLSLSGSLVIAATAFTSEHSLDFSAFPTLLLITTLLRVALDVSAARLILLTANAGTLVAAFGGFVVGSSPVVGVLVFILLFVVQYMVITRGAERVSEVAARFTLDAMAGKQMAIDADLHAGAITDEKAKQRRERIAQEADFYGAMDGASKFVRGDAIATLIILLVNVAAGLIVGVLFNHLTIGVAVSTYTALAIGDALLSQLPAFLLSTATGVLVTRAGSQNGSFSDVLIHQLSLRPEPFYLVGAFLLGIGVLMPVTPLVFVMAGLSGYAGFRIARRPPPPPVQDRPRAKTPADTALPDPITLTLGYSLVPLADVKQGGDLAERVSSVARVLTDGLGFTVARPRIRDDLSLEPTEYRLYVRTLEVARGKVMPGRSLVVAQMLPEVKGAFKVDDPIYGVPALWVPEESVRHLRAEGYTLTPASAVIAAHARQGIAQKAYQLIDRQGAQALLDRVKRVDKAAVEELVPAMLSLSQILFVLRNLLREGVPIRDGVTIVEALADAASQGSRDPMVLTERTRQALAPAIRRRIAPDRPPTLLQLPSSIREEARQSVQGDPPMLTLDPERTKQLVTALRRARVAFTSPVLLTPSLLRPFFARMLERHLPGLPVLSEAELDPQETYPIQVLDVGA